MTNKEILEDNVLIAEFMGIETKFYSDTPTIRRWNFNNSMLYDKDLKYHCSWDWLIPVCQKIESKESIILCEINGIKDSFTPYLNKTQAMKNGAIRFDLEKTYKGVIEFITWYNENKQH